MFFPYHERKLDKEMKQDRNFQVSQLSSNFEPFKNQWTDYQNIVEILLIFEPC